jgi:hypothetical protein
MLFLFPELGRDKPLFGSVSQLSCELMSSAIVTGIHMSATEMREAACITHRARTGHVGYSRIRVSSLELKFLASHLLPLPILKGYNSPTPSSAAPPACPSPQGTLPPSLPTHTLCSTPDQARPRSTPLLVEYLDLPLAGLEETTCWDWRQR